MKGRGESMALAISSIPILLDSDPFLAMWITARRAYSVALENILLVVYMRVVMFGQDKMRKPNNRERNLPGDDKVTIIKDKNILNRI